MQKQCCCGCCDQVVGTCQFTSSLSNDCWLPPLLCVLIVKWNAHLRQEEKSKSDWVQPINLSYYYCRLGCAAILFSPLPTAVEHYATPPPRIALWFMWFWLPVNCFGILQILLTLLVKNNWKGKCPRQLDKLIIIIKIIKPSDDDEVVPVVLRYPYLVSRAFVNPNTLLVIARSLSLALLTHSSASSASFDSNNNIVAKLSNAKLYYEHTRSSVRHRET